MTLLNELHLQDLQMLMFHHRLLNTALLRHFTLILFPSFIENVIVFPLPLIVTLFPLSIVNLLPVPASSLSTMSFLALSHKIYWNQHV